MVAIKPIKVQKATAKPTKAPAVMNRYNFCFPVWLFFLVQQHVTMKNGIDKNEIMNTKITTIRTDMIEETMSLYAPLSTAFFTS